MSLTQILSVHRIRPVLLLFVAYICVSTSSALADDDYDDTDSTASESSGGHSAAVTCIDLSVDDVVVSGSEDRTIRIWDKLSKKVTRVIPAHFAPVSFVLWSKDQKQIFSGSFDCTVRVWDAASGKQSMLIPNSDCIFGGSLSPDGKLIATGCQDGTAKIWNTATGKLVVTLSGHSDAVFAAPAFSPNGKLVATGGNDNLVKIWDIATGKELASLSGHKDWVGSVCFSPDGKTLASASVDKVVKVWDVAAGKELRSLVGHRNTVFWVRFSPDGNNILTGSGDTTIKVWDAKSGQLLRTLDHNKHQWRSFAMKADGSQIVSGDSECSIRFWNSTTGEEVASFAGSKIDETSAAESAVLQLSQEISRNPSANLYFLRAGTYEKEGNEQEMMNDFNRCLELNPKHLMARLCKATILLKQKNLDGAVLEARTAYESAPDDSRAITLYAFTLVSTLPPKSQGLQVAIKLLRRANEKTFWRDPKKILALAKTYEKAGESEKAIECQQKLSKLMMEAFSSK